MLQIKCQCVVSVGTLLTHAYTALFEYEPSGCNIKGKVKICGCRKTAPLTTFIVFLILFEKNKILRFQN